MIRSTHPGEPIMPIRRAALLLAPLLLLPLALPAANEPAAALAYTADGLVLPPAGYREWVYLSTGLDMSYSERARTSGHSMFDNVFVDPASWAAFKRTGHWPDKTRFVLEIRAASSQGSILKQGQYQTAELMGLEMHVRDDARGGWGFYSVENGKPARLLPRSEACYACHEQHGAVDTSFTQFYPTARPIAEQAGSFHAAP
jgi:hypothetical protein